MKAIILAGGRGERLKPLTNKVPKPMIDVAGKPILLHIINLFKKFGIKDFIFSLCYLPHVITSYFDDGSKFGVNIRYIYEEAEKPLGTAGGISLAKKYINGPFIVASGDILRDLDITDMIAFHKKKKSLTTLNVYKRYGPNPKSLIIFNGESQITEFVERPRLEQIKKDFVWANGSFYVLEPEIFDYIPTNRSSDFGKDIFPKLLLAKKRMYAYPTSGYFIDIGNHVKLEQAKKLFTA